MVDSFWSLIRICRKYSARHFESIRRKIRNNFSFVFCENKFWLAREGGCIALLLKDYGYMVGSLSFLICLRLVSVNVVILCTIVGDQVCYNHIGCFQNTPPYTNSLGKLPKSPDHIRPSFTLHTRQNVNSTSQQLDPYRPSTITASSYDVHHKTAFIVHGFHGTKNDEWVQPLVKALLDEVWLVLLHFRWVIHDGCH